jgi:translocation and assembly module TamB
VLVPHLAITPRLPIPDPFGGLAPAEDSAESPRDIPIIAASPDVVVRGRVVEAATPLPGGLPLDMELTLRLGDQVRIDAAGFKSRLSGELLLTQRPGQPEPLPQGKGAIRILDGSFRSFGQDLEIEWGQVLFDGVPLDQAELDIRAVRWIEDSRVKVAGVQISGLATAPQLTLFSRPQVDDQEIQSYLLTGRAPNAERDQTLTLGTEVTKGLFVGYGIDPLEGNQSFILRYDLRRWLGLSLEVGESDKRVNLTFTHER